MTTGSEYAQLEAVLARAQAEGALGSWPIADVVDHAREFVAALPPDVESVLDLGTGAGIPGLIIALDRPDLRVTLADRRGKRIDALRRACAVLGWTERVTPVAMDAEVMVRESAWRASFDVVVARGFAEPRTTLRLASQLARHHGRVIVSEPPDSTASRWDSAWCREYHVGSPQRHGRVVTFHVEHGLSVGRSDTADVPRGTPESPDAVVPRGTTSVAQGMDATVEEPPSGTVEP